MSNDKSVFDVSIELADNAMIKHFPDLFHEWNFERNAELGLDVYKVSKGMRPKVWWLGKCGHEWEATIYSRPKSRCPYCSSVKILKGFNDLWTVDPLLASQLLNPEDGYKYMQNSQKKVWWVGICGHEWEAVVASRTRGGSEAGCPVCNNKIVLIGFNDMWTTNPEQAKMLLNKEDGYKYTETSGKRVDWKCLECENIIKDRQISTIYENGISCSRCSDGVSFPQKFVFNLLKEENVRLVPEKVFGWSQGKRYDFYLPDHNWIIEVHGEQHYGKGFVSMGKHERTLEEEQENDRLKERLAKENGIENYIIIDARKSTVEHIRGSILDSDIIKLLSEIDFIRIGQLSSNSRVKTACDLWNSGIHSTVEIAEELGMNRKAIRKYLKRGVEIGWCDYSKELARIPHSKKVGKASRKSVVQLSLEYKYIKKWSSVEDASLSVGISGSGISAVCNGRQKSAGDYIWIRAEDYDENLFKNTPPLIRGKHTRRVVKMDSDMNHIKVYSSLTEAAKDNDITSGGDISSVCRGKRKTAGGFKWMYKEDYDEMISSQRILL